MSPKALGKLGFSFGSLRGCGSGPQTRPPCASMTPVKAFWHSSFNYDNAAMRRRARDASAAAEVDTSFLVLDGHSKLTRRVCCCKRTCRTHCAALGAFALIGCPATLPVLTRRDPPAVSGESRLCAYHRTLCTETYDGDIRRRHWKANVGKSLGDFVNVSAGSDEGKAWTIDVSSLEPYALTKHMIRSSVREFAQRQGTEAQHSRWLREDMWLMMSHTKSWLTSLATRAKW